MLASSAVSGQVVLAIAIGAALGAWYWDSPWPVALGAFIVAIYALDAANENARQSRLMWELAHPARPMRMHWTFSVMLTERAWETLGIPPEQREELQWRFGANESDLRRGFYFKGHPRPTWLSQPIGVVYERWGESLERWTIWNSWVAELGEEGKHHDKRVLEFLPAVQEQDFLDLWGDWKGPRFRWQEGRLFLVNVEDSLTTMPDGTLYVKEGSRVLFNIPAPTLHMSRADFRREKETNRLDRFAIPNLPAVDPIDPPFYHRWHGDERFQCEDWETGFRWELMIHDLRPGLPARVVRVKRSLWRRQVKGILVELDVNGARLIAHPGVVEPDDKGNTMPEKDNRVLAVLGDDGTVDRIWIS